MKFIQKFAFIFSFFFTMAAVAGEQMVEGKFRSGAHDTATGQAMATIGLEDGREAICMTTLKDSPEIPAMTTGSLILAVGQPVQLTILGGKQIFENCKVRLKVPAPGQLAVVRGTFGGAFQGDAGRSRVLVFSDAYMDRSYRCEAAGATPDRLNRDLVKDKTTVQISGEFAGIEGTKFPTYVIKNCVITAGHI